MSALDKFMNSFEDLNEDDKGQLRGGFESELTPDEGVSLDSNYGSCSNYAICGDNFGSCKNYGLCLAAVDAAG